MRQYIDVALADQARRRPSVRHERRPYEPGGRLDVLHEHRALDVARRQRHRGEATRRRCRRDRRHVARTEAQRTGINTHAKLLMLTHAFEVLRSWCDVKTDARNLRSRRAIERIGARLDGVLRAHMPAFDGGVRDTAFYSILRGEMAILFGMVCGRRLDRGLSRRRWILAASPSSVPRESRASCRDLAIWSGEVRRMQAFRRGTIPAEGGCMRTHLLGILLRPRFRRRGLHRLVGEDVGSTSQAVISGRVSRASPWPMSARVRARGTAPAATTSTAAAPATWRVPRVLVR